jgi:signal peptidase I
MDRDVNKVKGISGDLLKDGYDVRISTCGASMFPLIKTGDKITISPKSELNARDIIVFNRDEQMVCHRLVRIFERDGKRYFQTRGDSFFHLDDPVTADQILGKVIRIERGNVSVPRKMLLFIYPLLRIGRLNAFIINMLIKLRARGKLSIKQ